MSTSLFSFKKHDSQRQPNVLRSHEVQSGGIRTDNEPRVFGSERVGQRLVAQTRESLEPRQVAQLLSHQPNVVRVPTLHAWKSCVFE